MIGLIFGEKNFPIEILKKIKKRSLRYLIIDFTEKKKFKKDNNSYSVSMGQVGKILKILKENKCKKWHSFFKSKFSFLKDRVNQYIFLVIGLILFTSIINSINFIPTNLKDLGSSFIWLNLFNWIPALLGFIGFQSYIKSKEDRLLLSKCSICKFVKSLMSSGREFNSILFRAKDLI